MTLTCMSGMQTLLASWEVYADGAPGATVLRLPGLAAAVFPNEPARAVYNNAVLERIAVLSSVPDAVDAMEAACEASTLARGMPLDHIRLPPPMVELAPPDWSDYARIPAALAAQRRRSFRLPRPDRMPRR
jgi:hypothetical protein